MCVPETKFLTLFDPLALYVYVCGAEAARHGLHMQGHAAHAHGLASGACLPVCQGVAFAAKQ